MPADCYILHAKRLQTPFKIFPNISSFEATCKIDEKRARSSTLTMQFYSQEEIFLLTLIPATKLLCGFLLS